MDRAELIIKLTGDREALTSLKNLEAAMKNLNNSKTQLRVDKSLLDREINDVKNKLKELTKERHEIKLEKGNTDEIDAQIRDLRENLDALTSERRSVQLDISDINLANSGLKEAKTDLEEANQAAVDFINTLASVFDGLSSISGATANFATGIGDAFTAMAGMFDSNLFDYAQRKLTYMLTEGVVGDISKIVSRYDILSTFTQYMDAAGISSEKSAEALQRVNDAILGLPIGLDEAAYRLRRYQMFLDDINDATNLTIGLQNVLLAGGASESMRNVAYQQIDRLLSAGKLNTSRQWLALIQGMGVSLRYVRQEMGVADMSARELAAGLTSGSISTEQFLRALMNLGEGTSPAARDLSGLLDIYRTTLESWISNIQFAAVRGGETVLKSLNEALLDVSDQGIVGYLKDLRDAMNEFYKGVGGFITGNPQLLDRTIGSISGLFDALGRFSASDIATMIFDNMARGLDMLASALNRLPTDEVEQFVSFAVTLAGPLGALFDMVASGAPAVIAIFERFKDFDFEHLLDRIITEVDRLASVYEYLLNILGDDALTELITFGLVYGGPAAKGFGAIADALSKIAFALAGFSALGSGLAWIKELFAGIAAAAGTLTTALSGLAEILPVVGGVAMLGGFLNEVDKSIAQDYRRPYGFAQRMSRSELEQFIKESEATLSDYEYKKLIGDLPYVDFTLGSTMSGLRMDLEEAKERLERMDGAAEGAADGMTELADATTTASDAVKEAADTSQTLESRLNEIYTKINIAGEQFSATLAKQIDVFSEFEQAAVRALTGEGGLQAAMDSNIKALADYETNLEKAARIIAENPNIGPDVSSLFQKVAAGGLESAGDLAGLVDAFENNYDAFLGYVKSYVEEQSLEISVESWGAALTAGLSSEEMSLYLVDQFGTAIEKALATMPDTLANRLGAESHFEELEAFGKTGGGSGLKTQFEKIGQSMAEVIVDGAENADMSGVGQTVAENAVEATAEAFNNVDLSPIADTLSARLTEALTEAFSEQNLLTTMFNVEDTVLVTESIAGLTEAMAPVQELTIAFYESYLPEIQAAILALIDVIKELLDEIDRLIDALEDAQRKTDDLRSSVEDLGRSIAAQLPVIDELTGAIDGVSSAAAEAAEAVAELAAALMSLESVEVGVAFEAPSALSTNTGGARAVYRASGGFIPRGTDTVPAMLTPGEFVMRRSAVKAFGVDFMRKLNNLDIGGMVAAMYRQIPQMAGFMPVYNTYNNDNRNVTVNQNIHTNNPSYTYRMASRWAHAL